MSTLNKYFNVRINPFTGEQEPKHITAGDGASDYPFIQSPLSYNAPEDAPVRIEIELPETPYLLDTVNKPFKLYKTAIAPANLLTPVSGEPTSDNTYRIGLQNLERSHCLQLAENLLDTPIYFDYYGIGTVLNKDNLENMIVETITAFDSIESVTANVGDLTCDTLDVTTEINLFHLMAGLTKAVEYSYPAGFNQNNSVIIPKFTHPAVTPYIAYDFENYTVNLYETTFKVEAPNLTGVNDYDAIFIKIL